MVSKETESTKESNKIVAVAAFAAFLATFNETFLNVAFTPIMTDFGINVSSVQWLATAYMLGAAVMVPISAFAYRRIPTKVLFLTTVSALVLGSVIGALATSFPVLLTGRIIQSFGTGMLIPIGMNITLEVAPQNKLGTYMGLMGAMTTLGPSLSVIIAGVLLSAFNWHSLLWVFAALSLLLFLSAIVLLNNIAHLTKPKLDIFSVILIGLALIGLLYGISTIFAGSVLTAVLFMIAGAVLLAIFVIRQNKLDQPLINLKPLTVKPFTIGVIINMISLIVIFAMNIIMPMFMQSAKGSSSFQASMTLFPAILLSCIVAPIAGKICDKHGTSKLLPMGFIFISGFTVALAFTGNSAGLLVMAVLYIPVICGSALIIGPIQSFALSKLSPELNPHGVTVMSTGFQIAGCIGSSVFTGVYSITMNHSLGSGFEASSMLAAALSLIGIFLSICIHRKPASKTDNINNSASVPSADLLHLIMKTDVYKVDTNATLLEALKIITEKKISGMPVTNNTGDLVGFISDGDIMRCLTTSQPLFESIYSLASMDTSDAAFDEKINLLKTMKVSDIAVSKAITADINDNLEKICRVLHDHHLKKIPIMKDEKIAGIINRSNIIKYVAHKCLLTGR